MNSKNYSFILLINCLLIKIGFTQTISNINYKEIDGKAIITYDLLNCKPNELYKPNFYFIFNETRNKFIPKSISGDINFISCGNKKIIWDYQKDLDSVTLKLLDKYNPSIHLIKCYRDIDGNIYETVDIGNKTWFTENLKTTKYNDGTPIPNVKSKIKWNNLATYHYVQYAFNPEQNRYSSGKGAWCYYENDSIYNKKYGKLYNWYVITSEKNVCPKGWRVPSGNDWYYLENDIGKYYRGDDFIGGKMKVVDTLEWIFPNTNASNTSRFTGYPAGLRLSNGEFANIRYFGYWWSSSNSGDSYELSYDDGYLTRSFNFANSGISIRCVKDY